MGSYDLMMTLQRVGGWTFAVCLIVMILALVIEEPLQEDTKIIHRVVHYIGYISAVLLVLGLITAACPSLFVKKTTYYSNLYDVEAMAEKYNAVVNEIEYNSEKVPINHITLFSGLGNDQWVYYKIVDNEQSEFLLKDGENNG